MRPKGTKATGIVRSNHETKKLFSGLRRRVNRTNKLASFGARKAPPAPVVTAREARETQLFVLNKIAEQLVQNDTFFATATVFVTPDGMIRGAVFSDLATDRPAPRSKSNGT